MLDLRKAVVVSGRDIVGEPHRSLQHERDAVVELGALDEQHHKA